MTSYESQLTPDELQKLRAALSEPSPNMAKIQAEAPPWRNGPHAGSQPVLKTLYNLQARFDAECAQAEVQTTTDLLKKLNGTLLDQPDFDAASPKAANQVFSLVCHEILRRTLRHDNSKTRIQLLRLFLRYQQFLFQKARHQHATAEQFNEWLENGPLKEQLNELTKVSAAQRMDAIGRAIYGEDWHPELVNGPIIPFPDGPPLNPAPFDDEMAPSPQTVVETNPPPSPPADPPPPATIEPPPSQANPESTDLPSQQPVVETNPAPAHTVDPPPPAIIEPPPSQSNPESTNPPMEEAV